MVIKFPIVQLDSKVSQSCITVQQDISREYLIYGEQSPFSQDMSLEAPGPNIIKYILKEKCTLEPLYRKHKCVSNFFSNNV